MKPARLNDSSGPVRERTGRTGLPAVLFLAAALLALVLPVAAHAPSDIAISYKPDIHQLSVTVTHPVDDPKTHYIRGVRVKINGAVISDPDYKSQPGRNSFTYTYDVMANPGDAVWVVATCVNGQSLEDHIEIPAPAPLVATVVSLPPETTTPVPETTTGQTAAPAATYADPGLLPATGAIAALIFLRMKSP